MSTHDENTLREEANWTTEEAIKGKSIRKIRSENRWKPSLKAYHCENVFFSLPLETKLSCESIKEKPGIEFWDYSISFSSKRMLELNKTTINNGKNRKGAKYLNSLLLLFFFLHHFRDEIIQFPHRFWHHAYGNSNDSASGNIYQKNDELLVYLSFHFTLDVNAMTQLPVTHSDNASTAFHIFEATKQMTFL